MKEIITPTSQIMWLADVTWHDSIGAQFSRVSHPKRTKALQISLARVKVIYAWRFGLRPPKCGYWYFSVRVVSICIFPFTTNECRHRALSGDGSVSRCLMDEVLRWHRVLLPSAVANLNCTAEVDDMLGNNRDAKNVCIVWPQWCKLALSGSEKSGGSGHASSQVPALYTKEDCLSS